MWIWDDLGPDLGPYWVPGDGGNYSNPTDPMGSYVRPAKCRNKLRLRRSCQTCQMPRKRNELVKGRRYGCWCHWCLLIYSVTMSQWHPVTLCQRSFHYDHLLWPMISLLCSNRVQKLWVSRGVSTCVWSLGGVFRKLDAKLHGFVSRSQAALASSTASTSLAGETWHLCWKKIHKHRMNPWSPASRIWPFNSNSALSPISR